MTAAVVLAVIFVAVAVLGGRYAVDTRPGVDDPAPGWLGRPTR